MKSSSWQNRNVLSAFWSTCLLRCNKLQGIQFVILFQRWPQMDSLLSPSTSCHCVPSWWCDTNLSYLISIMSSSDYPLSSSLWDPQLIRDNFIQRLPLDDVPNFLHYVIRFLSVPAMWKVSNRATDNGSLSCIQTWTS